jgi:hypothetical protein
MVVEEEIENSSINELKSWIDGGWRGKRDMIKDISEKVE